MSKARLRRTKRLLLALVVLFAGLRSRVEAASFFVTNLSDLRTAIQQANTSPGLDVITLAPGTYTFSPTATPDSGRGQINPLDGDLDITDDLLIEGNGAVIDANHRDRVFYIQGTSATLISVTIRQLTLRNGRCDPLAPIAPGGALFAWLANVTLEGCRITDNSTTEDGGGVAVFGYYDDVADAITRASLTLNSTAITNNQGENGGGIATGLATLNILGGTLLNNTALATSATFGGGGLLATGNDCGAQATGRGTISGNTSGGSGGGLGLFGVAPASLTGCAISGNLAGVSGGGLELFETSPTLTNCLLTSNTALTGGGALNCHTRSSPVVMNCTISGNFLSALPPQGGGIRLRDGSHPFLMNSIFEGNGDWAVFADSNSTPSILAHCLFFNNSGGALSDPVHGGYLDSEMNRLNSELPYAAGNLAGDPRFANKAAADYHIFFPSAALDQGTSRTQANGKVLTAPLADRDGNPRPVDFPGIGRDGPGEGYDVGAYELLRPIISVSPVSFFVSAPVGTPLTTRSLLVSNGRGIGTVLDYVIATSPTWLACLPTTGTSTGEVTTHTVLLHPAGLSAGDHAGTITVTALEAGNSPVRIPVTLRVLPLNAPVLAAEPPFTKGTTNSLSWSAVSGAAGYFLQWSTNGSFVPVAGDSGWIVPTTRVAGGLLDGQTYFYRVKCRNIYLAESAWSNIVSSRQDATPPTAPGTPQSPSGATSQTTVRFAWTAATDGISGVVSYDLQVGTAPSGGNVFNANVGNVLTRTVPGANGQTLYARARARDRVDNIGPWSGNSSGIRVDTVAPRLIGAVAPNYVTLVVSFDEPVRNGAQPANYTCTRGLLVLGGVRLNDTRYRLSTSPQTQGTSYTVTVVGSGIRDLAGNPVDPRYRSRSFIGDTVTRAASWELYR